MNRPDHGPPWWLLVAPALTGGQVVARPRAVVRASLRRHNCDPEYPPFDRHASPANRNPFHPRRLRPRQQATLPPCRHAHRLAARGAGTALRPVGSGFVLAWHGSYGPPAAPTG